MFDKNIFDRLIINITIKNLDEIENRCGTQFQQFIKMRNYELEKYGDCGGFIHMVYFDDPEMGCVANENSNEEHCNYKNFKLNEIYSGFCCFNYLVTKIEENKNNVYVDLVLKKS